MAFVSLPTRCRTAIAWPILDEPVNRTTSASRGGEARIMIGTTARVSAAEDTDRFHRSAGRTRPDSWRCRTNANDLHHRSGSAHGRWLQSSILNAYHFAAQWRGDHLRRSDSRILQADRSGITGSDDDVGRLPRPGKKQLPNTRPAPTPGKRERRRLRLPARPLPAARHGPESID